MATDMDVQVVYLGGLSRHPGLFRHRGREPVEAENRQHLAVEGWAKTWPFPCHCRRESQGHFGPLGCCLA